MFTYLLIHLALVVLPPCEYEDSANCVWDAQTAGLANGGRSFIDIGGTAYYTDLRGPNR